jgi:hypothetical protein
VDALTHHTAASGLFLSPAVEDLSEVTRSFGGFDRT